MRRVVFVCLAAAGVVSLGSCGDAAPGPAVTSAATASPTDTAVAVAADESYRRFVVNVALAMGSLDGRKLDPDFATPEVIASLTADMGRIRAGEGVLANYVADVRHTTMLRATATEATLEVCSSTWLMAFGTSGPLPLPGENKPRLYPGPPTQTIVPLRKGASEMTWRVAQFDPDAAVHDPDAAQKRCA